MFTITEAATRCGMPAFGTTPTAYVAVPATGASAAYKALIVDARNGAQGASDAWSPPV